ncbi:hypothetical protein G7074_15555 [Pedobacter sp. HDW13]|uniref:hypothetical protein n=1 Tax=unclassified Pedobacter TaxID=2628915 RepID=UPI000F5B8335|nr:MULTISPECIES: hypothetical protein [unclassified Pedobacter]QIL40559.1 hypothetical protein G7074_15555 [Pedobacter sp. HDW13]RQO66885.1 hypothetical protein DBR40_21785 [Pedobacter sp. KBW01]
MKRFCFFLLLLLSFYRVSAQNRGYGKTEWSVAKQAPCFPNLYVSYKSIGYEPSVTAYTYNWRIENRSDKRVSFTFGPWIVAADGKLKEKMNGGLFVLDPGQTYTHSPGYNKVLPQGSSMEFFITAYSDVKGGPSYNCANGTKYCVSNCAGTATASSTGSKSTSRFESTTSVGATNGQASGSGSTQRTGAVSAKQNVAEVTLQATRGTYSVRAVIDNVQCPGSIRLGLDPDAGDGKKLTIYVMPKADSGTFASDNAGGNCALHAILYWFENGKYRYTTPNLTVTKTGLNSFTFTGTLNGGETISGSGNYTLVQ